MKISEFLDLLCETLEKEKGSITLKDNQDTLPEWDSLGHLSILAVLETSLGVNSSDSDFPEFDSIGQLVEILKQCEALED